MGEDEEPEAVNSDSEEEDEEEFGSGDESSDEDSEGEGDDFDVNMLDGSTGAGSYVIPSPAAPSPLVPSPAVPSPAVPTSAASTSAAPSPAACSAELDNAESVEVAPMAVDQSIEQEVIDIDKKGKAGANKKDKGKGKAAPPADDATVALRRGPQRPGRPPSAVTQSSLTRVAPPRPGMSY